MSNPDDLLVFHEEAPAAPAAPGKPWRVLIVDDEPEVHAITALVLKEFEFEGRRLEFLHARSGAEAKRVMAAERGIAVVLLDIVMETDDAGLAVADWIRNELGDRQVRIVLRTGQPGAAPEKQVITRFDINDYKEKTELTEIKLWTCVTVALRGYRDLSTISRSRQGLEKIVRASVMFSERQSLAHFFQGVLIQLTSLLHIDEHSMMLRADGVALQGGPGGFSVLSATGDYEHLVGQALDGLAEPTIRRLAAAAIERKAAFFEANYYIGYMAGEDGSENIVILRSPNPFAAPEREIISVFCSNASIALLNISLNQSIEETQHEMIFTLGEVIESRSIETGMHVKRVAALGALLAGKAGFEERDVDQMRIALPLHDIGKIGLPDNILNKPGPLDEAELMEMRKHTLLGYNLLRGGSHKTLQMAAMIALTHHERWDGKGYPQALAGTQIPLVGRITCVVDVFDALVNSRAYKAAWSFESVVAYLNQNSGSQFDPNLIRLFNDSLSEIRDIIDTFQE